MGSNPISGTNFDEESPGYVEFLQRVAHLASDQAVEEAYRNGLSITYLKDGVIWEEWSDGTRLKKKVLKGDPNGKE